MMQNSIRQNWELNAFSDYEGDTITYKEVACEIKRLHFIFDQLEIKKGDKIALVGRNHSNWAVIYLAVVTYGAVIVPILPDFLTSDIHHIINHSDSVLLFASDSIYERIDESKMKHLKGIVSLDTHKVLFDNEFGRFKDAIDKALRQSEKCNNMVPEEFSLKDVDLEELAVISYTSGTSGFSKGVILKHKSIWSNSRIGWDHHVDLRPADRIVSFLPLAHAYGCLFEFLTPFVMGCHITFLTRTPTHAVIIKAFREIKPRLILAVPLIIEKIYKKQILTAINNPKVKWALKVPILKQKVYKKINQKLTMVFGGEFIQIIVGGAALNKDVEEFLYKIGFRFTVGYGMTECGPIISYASWEDHRVGSAGKIVTRMDVRIDSPDPYNTIGEIQVKGDNVFLEYYKNPEATLSVFTDDGWLKTGDLGIIDKEKYIYIKGRSKNMILGPSGQNIYPEEIESKLANLPYVMECLVRNNNNKLEALVYPDFELADSENLRQTEIEEIMKQNRDTLNAELPTYMNISKITILPEEFKKTPKKSIKRYLYNID